LNFAEREFLESSFLYRSCYILAATSVARWKYYLAWILADAICNASGLGFGGYDEYGFPRWDLISNVDVAGVEVGVSFRDLIDSWNKGTSRWLRMTVYERVPRLRTLSAYLVSACWHGFYPGYYLTFIGGALFTLASRAVSCSLSDFVIF
jgi:lysophospholipid acyltransferase 1/2